MELFTDRSMAVYEAALDAVAERQRLISHNIANVATPGYKAKRLEFEAALSGAIERGDSVRDLKGFEPGVTLANTPARGDGNSVALEEETTDLAKSSLQFEALVSSLNFKFGVLRTAITGR